MATPASAEAAAILPVLLINSRREVGWVSFIGVIFLTLTQRCQFKKSGRGGDGSYGSSLRNFVTATRGRCRSRPFVEATCELGFARARGNGFLIERALGGDQT